MAISLDDLDPIPTGKRLSLDTLDPIKKAPKPVPRRSLDVATESLIGVDRVTAAERDAEYERKLTPEQLRVKRNQDRIADKQTDEAFDAVQAKQIASQPKYQSFGAALRAGIDDAQKLVGAGVEATAEILGGRSGKYSDEQGVLDAFAEYGKDTREENTREADEYGPRGKFADISSVGDAFAWARQTAGNMIPVMVPAAVGGAAGAALAPAAGVTATVGGIVGAFIPSVVVSTGEVQANAKDKDPTKTANGWTFAGGSAIAALDSVLPGRIGGKLVEKFGRDAAEEIAMRALLRPAGAKLGAEAAKGALKEGVKSAAIEGLTESVQEAIGEVSASLASESKIDWQGLPANMLESGAAGALMGGGTGAPTGAITAVKDAAEGNRINAGYQAGVNREAAGLTLPTETDPEADFSSFVEARNREISPDPKADVPLTEADRASPLPDALIQKGKNVAADALGANRPPRAAAAPARALPPVANNFDKIVQITGFSESGNRERDKNGNLITSPVGAKGKMQVMPGTETDPGFGVKPMQNGSDAERTRVGRDYLAAMLRRYNGDPAKMWAAYNWGPGALDNAIAKHGADWLDHAPAETRGYVFKNMSKLGGGAFNRESGEALPVEVPEQAELDSESAEDYARRVLGDDIFDASPNEEVAPASLEVEAGITLESLEARADALTEKPIGEIERQGADLRGDPIDEEFVSFAEDSGTLGVPRAEMPQIKAENRGAMVNYLKARNVTSTKETVPAAALKPTQQEFSPSKVQKAKEFVGGNRSILVSSDGYVLDGHHQWLAARDNGEDIDTLRLDAPIAELIPLARDFPSSELAEGATGQAIPQGEFYGQSRAIGTGKKPTRRGGGYGTFMEYLADIGGVRDDEGHSLSKMRGMQQPIAGAGSLIRANGRSIDAIGEKAYEDGWFTQRPTTAQILDLIETAQFQKVYHPLEDGDRRAEDNAAEEEVTVDRLRESAADMGVELNEDELAHAMSKVASGQSIDSAMISAVEWGAARDFPAILAQTQDSDYDVPFDLEEGPANEQKGKADEGVSQGSERPETDARNAGDGEASPQEPSGDSQPEVTDTPSGKGVVVRGASEAQLAAITAALPEKASGMVNKDGAVTYSKKHEDKIRAALASASLGEAPAAPVNAVEDAPTRLYHGSPKGDLSINDIQIIGGEGRKQGKAGRSYGGFYAAAEDRISDAQGYAGDGGTVYQIDLKPGTVTERKDGDVTRLSEQTIEEYRARGVDVIVGKDPRGRTEYAIINKEAIAEFRKQEAPKKPDFAGAVERNLSNEQVDAVAAIFDRAEKRAKPATNKFVNPGEQYRFSKRVDYLGGRGPQEIYTVERVGKNDAYFRAEDGSGSSLKYYLIRQAIADGVMTRVESEPVSNRDELPTDKENLTVAPTLAGGVPVDDAANAARAAKPATWGASNKGVTRERAAQIREELKAELRSVRDIGRDEQGTFNPKLLALGTELAAFHIEAGARKFAEFAKAIADDLGMTLAEVKPYLRAWYVGAQAMMEDAGQDVADMDGPGAVKAAITMIDDATPAAAAPQAQTTDSSGDRAALMQAFMQAFIRGEGFASITEARKLASETLGRKVEAGTADAKMLDEAIETAVVQVGRKIAIENADDAPQAYQRLVGLYNRQPKLGVRTSTSIEQQAYSTPAPLSFLASRLAGISQTTTVYEPSAGNGALLIDARATFVTANELNPDRVAQLRSIYRGATITQGDAMADNLAPKQFDVVIGNPPFGPVKDGAGNNVDFEVGGFTTREIDHAIALKSLEKMKDDGSAVLIVGGINKMITDPKARADAYNGKAKREFYFRLYSQYNVVDHFTVDGSLYERQGAGWPVDLIVIKGRGKSALSLPAVRAPRQYNSWQELTEVLSNERPQEATRPVRATDGEFVAERTGPAAVDGGDIGSGGIGGTVGRIGSDTPQQPEPVRDGPVDGQPDSPSVGGTGSGVVEPVSDQRQRRVDREDTTGLTENARQVIYQPGSDATAMGTLVPVNMQTAVDTALDVLRSRVGNIDDYVATQLGYTRDTLYKAFAAEQIDALALAIHNIEDKGAGFIIGDQTGIGKGRVVAGVIRYAMRQGRPPIFVTEKANLFADIYRDLVDIGVPDMLGRDLNIVMTNSGESVPLGEGLGELKSKGSKAHTALLQKLAAEGLQSEGVDVLFTTYSQMQTVKGEETDRQRVLDSLAQGGVLLLDESHNAGGTTGGFKKAGAPLNRADFVRKLVGKAHGVFYSSATYAKRPDVMSLYAATDMRLAVKKIEDLGDAIGKGGVPMQQVVAAMLARAGQYVRRERSFEGIAYNTPIVEVDRDQYAATAGILSSIQNFSEDYVGAATEKLDEQLRAEGESLGFDNAVGKAGASSTNFTAIMHNVIDQMLLAFSADATADRAIAAIENGEKPVITVANTLESMLDQYAEVAGINIGDEMQITFADVFRRYLERSRWITIKKPQGFVNDDGKEVKSERVRLTDGQLGSAGVAAFNDTLQMIDEAGLESLPGSPIDYILSRIQDAGYKVGEITGRGTGINYRNGKAYLKVRPDAERSIKGRLKTINGFNDGSIDVVLLNRSGSTGLSLHASEKFKDQRKRRMIIAQAEGNIDTHMQMLGRVHRTGQVVLPEYDQIVIGVPAAKRPAANLARKMASLNASTTASRDSALTSKESVDFMNIYGDMVVAAIMQEEPDIHRMLAEPLAEEDEGYMIDGAARKVTGRIPLLPVAMQEELYDRIESEYKALLEQKEAAGENALEAKTYDLQARVVSSQQVVDPRDASSPFGEAVFVDKVSVKRLGKPYTGEKVIERIAEANGVDVPEGTPAEALKVLFNRIAPDFNAETTEALQKGQEWAADDIAMTKDDAAKEKRREKNGDIMRDFRALRALLVPGRTIRILTENGNFYGTVSAGFKTGKAKNPLALGSWKVTIDVVDAARSLTFPFSQLSTTSMENGKVKVEAADSIGLFSIIDAYSNMQVDSREERSIVTGNMLAGFDYVKGRGAIINYTTEDGDVRQGIMLNKDFDLEKHIARQPISFTTPEMVLAWLETLREPLVGTGKTGSVSLFANQYRGEFTVVAAKSKKVGGEFFLNSDLTRELGRDFVSRSNGMVAEVSLSRAKGVIETLLSMGVDFTVDGTASAEVKDRAREIVERFQPKPKMSIGGGLFDEPAQPERTMTEKQRAELEARQKQGMARKGGQTGLGDQDGGLFSSERDQGALFSQPRARMGGEFGRKAPTVPAGFAATTSGKLQNELNKLGIGDRVTLKVAGKIMDNAYIRGLYYKNVIQIATSKNPNPFETLNHEAIHALKDLGLFKPAEWRALEAAARADKAMMSSIRSRYKNEGLTESELVEEGVADMFAAWRAGTRAERGFIRDAFERIVSLFRALRRAIAGANAQDEAAAIVREQALAVMESIGSGELGSRRSSMEGIGQGQRRFSIAEPVESDAFKKWFGNSKIVDDGGNPLVVYHGSADKFNVFKKGGNFRVGYGKQMPGIYFSALKGTAESYARTAVNAKDRSKDGPGVVVSAYLSIQNPAIFRDVDDFAKADRAALEALGHDGAIRYNNYDVPVEIAAFEPEQIKSATENNGEFDPGNPDIRYSITRRLIGEGVTDKIIDRLDRWRTNLQDRMLPLLRAQQRVEAQSGIELDEAANPYLAEELMSGKVGARLERLTDEMVTPLFDSMKAEGIDAEELETYLYARHATERNERISRINSQFDEGTGSGMSDAEAAGILTMAEAEGKLTALERLAERVDEMLRFAVQTRVEAGLLSQEEADAWADTYQFYVPLRGFAEIEPEAGEAERPRAGSGINVRGPESKRAFGRTSKAADILAYSIMQAEEAIVRAGRNEVAQAFYQMVKANPDPEFWTTKTVRRTPVWNEKSGTVSYRTTDQIDPQDADYTVSLKIDGQERRVTMNRENPKAVQLAVAMRNLDGQDLGAVMRVLSGVNRYLSFVNTGLNPEFVITNAFRDIQTAGINLAQFDRAGLVTGTMKDYRKALVASVRGSFKNPREGSEWAGWYDEFLENGGRVYFNRVDDMNELRKRIEKQMQASTGTLGVARSTFTNIKEFIENANMGVENGIRLSAYKNARERGMSPAQAASLAKNLTVNFNRRGAWGVAMNSLYLFYNASVQGSARLLQASFAKGKGGNRVRMILGAAVAIGYGLDMLNMMLSDDDDDGESFYDKVSDFDKSRNLIIMLPGERGKHVKIPLPYGYNAFYALGRAASQISRGEDWKGATGMFLQTVVDAFNPVGGTDNIMNLVAPTIADPIVDLTRNRDFADRPIMPEQGTYAPDTPDSQKYWDSISPHYRVVTDTLNSMTGGDEVVGGAIDVSPETLQHLSGVVTGAAGVFFIDRIGGLVEKTVNGEEITANDLPLVRKVVGTKPSWYDKAAFYERMDQIENVVADVKEYRTREEDDKADAYEDANVDVLDMVKPMKAAKKEMRKLKKERGKIEMQRDIGEIAAEDAAAEIMFLRDEEKLIIEEFNATYIDTVAKPKRP